VRRRISVQCGVLYQAHFFILYAAAGPRWSLTDVSICVQIIMMELMVTALRLEWSCCSAGPRLLPGSDPVVLQLVVLS